jgi:hypothetical protein
MLGKLGLPERVPGTQTIYLSYLFILTAMWPFEDEAKNGGIHVLILPVGFEV